MNFSLVLLVAMALFIMATAQEVGCQPKPPQTGEPYPADPTNPDVLLAVDFAVADSYDMDTTTYTVLSGTEQIVNGKNYDLTVAVTETADGYCTVFNYVVYVTGDPARYELTSSTELTDQQC
jgi:Cystatin domain